MDKQARKAKALEKAEARNAAVRESLASPAGTPSAGELASFQQVLSGVGVKMAFNVRAERPMLKAIGVKDLPPEWAVMNDRKEDLLKCTMEADWKDTWSMAKWRQLLNAHLQTSERDPLLEWLKALPAWDGTERIASVLGDLFGARDELSQWASSFLFLGIVERTFSPGAKLDEVPVLIGPQGVGKSSLLENLLPPAMMAHNCVLLGADEKTIVEASLGKAVLEASEMAGVHKAETSRIKMVLTRTVDTVRLSYARNPVDRPRRFIVVGTSNDRSCLPDDETGNRRFVVVDCAGEPWVKEGRELRRSFAGPVEPWLEERREQLFAEAVRLVSNGRTAGLPGRLKPLAGFGKRELSPGGRLGGGNRVGAEVGARPAEEGHRIAGRCVR